VGYQSASGMLGEVSPHSSIHQAINQSFPLMENSASKPLFSVLQMDNNIHARKGSPRLLTEGYMSVTKSGLACVYYVFWFGLLS